MNEETRDLKKLIKTSRQLIKESKKLAEEQRKVMAQLQKALDKLYEVKSKWGIIEFLTHDHRSRNASLDGFALVAETRLWAAASAPLANDTMECIVHYDVIKAANLILLCSRTATLFTSLCEKIRFSLA